jgi:hypothetical protein
MNYPEYDNAGEVKNDAYTELEFVRYQAPKSTSPATSTFEIIHMDVLLNATNGFFARFAQYEKSSAFLNAWTSSLPRSGLSASSPCARRSNCIASSLVSALHQAC